MSENKILDCVELMETNSSLTLPTTTQWGGACPSLALDALTAPCLLSAAASPVS